MSIPHYILYVLLTSVMRGNGHLCIPSKTLSRWFRITVGSFKYPPPLPLTFWREEIPWSTIRNSYSQSRDTIMPPWAEICAGYFRPRYKKQIDAKHPDHQNGSSLLYRVLVALVSRLPCSCRGYDSPIAWERAYLEGCMRMIFNSLNFP